MKLVAEVLAGGGSSNNEIRNTKSLEELKYEYEQEELLKEKRELKNQETASKILELYNLIKPYLKFIIPTHLISFCICLFLFDKYFISLIFLSPIGALICAFFTKPK